MRKNSGRIIAACCVLVALAGVLAYTFIFRTPRAAAQAVVDVGNFKVGSALGEERAGFSGRPKVQVFVTANDPNWPTISACLQSPDVEAEMGSFVGVLVDTQAESDVETAYRQRHALQVVVRGLDGAFLGGLPSGFTCADLIGLLRTVRASRPGESEKSPVYASLLESSGAIDYMVQNGERVQASHFVDLLRDFEGSKSQAVKAAEAALNR